MRKVIPERHIARGGALAPQRERVITRVRDAVTLNQHMLVRAMYIHAVRPCPAAPRCAICRGRWAGPRLLAGPEHRDVARGDVNTVAHASRVLRHPEGVLRGAAGDGNVLDDRIADGCATERQPARVLAVVAVRRRAARRLEGRAAAHRVAVRVPRVLDADVVQVRDAAAASEHEADAVHVVQAAAVEPAAALRRLRRHGHDPRARRTDELRPIR